MRFDLGLFYDVFVWFIVDFVSWNLVVWYLVWWFLFLFLLFGFCDWLVFGFLLLWCLVVHGYYMLG